MRQCGKPTARLRWGLLGAMLVLAACGTAPRLLDQPPSPGGGGTRPYTINGVRYVPHADPDYNAVGTASWYGRKFHGRRTASGERYDMNAMTSAHTTLPFGTKVQVTNLGNGRSVVLRVNDRGPFKRGRIIDVSRHAAEHLRFLGAGTARVRVQVLPR